MYICIRERINSKRNSIKYISTYISTLCMCELQTINSALFKCNRDSKGVKICHKTKIKPGA